jgi:hypothetical protein
MKGKRSVLIYAVIRQTVGTKHQYLLSRFLGISILQLFINYRIYDYNMLTSMRLSRHEKEGTWSELT